MKNCAERIAQKREQYLLSDNIEVQMDCIDIVTAKLNDFTQVFKVYCEISDYCREKRLTERYINKSDIPRSI